MCQALYIHHQIDSIVSLYVILLSHFIGEETEAQRGSVTYSSSIDRKSEWNSNQSGSKSHDLTHFCGIACSHSFRNYFVIDLGYRLENGGLKILQVSKV